MQTATLGQLLINRTLPEDMRDYSRVLDKKGLMKLLEQVARKHPDKYKDVSHKLNQIGLKSSQEEGGMSFGMRHLRRSKAANVVRKRVRAKLAKILSDDTLTPKRRKELIIRAVGSESEAQQKAILEEAIANKNPLAMQVLSGSRGKPMNLASLLGSDMLYSDHRDEVIPIPVLRSYSEGLSPEEYWAGTYGARRGIIATKFATQDAGFLSKQLNQAGHRLVVMGEDSDKAQKSPYLRGMIADTDDMDNEGALLAKDTGPYKRNTPLTPKILKDLKRRGKARILIRSPLVGGSPEGGVYARDVGIRETGRLPGRGEQVGLQAAQALSEPISQGQLSAKHSGGVAGQEKAVGGFEYINQLIQTPKNMKGGAAHSTLDGTVQRIEDGPAGGQYVTINDEKHYVGSGFTPSVKKGDKVEAGDLLSDGIPNPGIITKYKGVGEGRRYFVTEFKKAMGSSGMRGHRRNIELLARGLINHVKITEETDDNAPDDIIPYSTIEHTYKPRRGHQVLRPKKAVGQFLERPVLHYTIGTKVRPSMLKDFEEFGVKEIPVHKEPPPFEPHMVRGMFQLQHDPDWMTQMYGSGLKKSLLESTARGATSEMRGTSFVPSLALGTDFGEVADRAVIAPQAGYKLPNVSPAPVPPVMPTAPSVSPLFGGRFKSTTKTAAPTAGVDTTKPGAKPAGGNIAATNSDSNLTAKTQDPPPASSPSFFESIGNIFNSSGSQPANLATTRLRNQTYAKNINPSIMPQSAPQPQPVPQPQPTAPPQSAPQPQPVPQPQPTAPPQSAPQPQPVPQPQPTVSPQSVPQPQPVPAPQPPPQSVPQPQPVPEPYNPSKKHLQELSMDPYDPPEEVFTSNPPNAGNTDNGGFWEKLLGLELVGTAANELAKRSPFASPVQSVPKGFWRNVPQALRTGLLPGSNAVKTLLTGAAGVTGATGAAAALGGAISVNAVHEVLDAAGLIPRVAGGTGFLAPKAWGGSGMDAFGWDQKGFDLRTRQMTPAWQGVTAMMNPLKSLYEINKGQGELFSAGVEKSYDTVTGTTSASRARDSQRKLGKNFYDNRRVELQQQIDSVNKSLSSSNLSPIQRKAVEDARAVLAAKMHEGQQRLDSLTDETADWNLGNQHYFGDKGHKFRDAMVGSSAQYRDEIAELGGLASPASNELQRLESLKSLQTEADGYIKQYGNENFTEEDFAGRIRNGVQSAKRTAATLNRQLFEPAIRDNPEEFARVSRELEYAKQRLRMLREWGQAAE